MPDIGDAAFEHTVVYICEHTELGAMGFIINRPLDLSIAEVWDELHIPVTNLTAIGEATVLDGGPLDKSRGFIFYKRMPSTDLDENAIELTNELSLTASDKLLRKLAAGTGPEKVLFVLGYAEWDAGQLEAEIIENAWLHTPANLSILFEVPIAERLTAAYKLLGIDCRTLSREVGHA